MRVDANRSSENVVRLNRNCKNRLTQVSVRAAEKRRPSNLATAQQCPPSQAGIRTVRPKASATLPYQSLLCKSTEESKRLADATLPMLQPPIVYIPRLYQPRKSNQRQPACALPAFSS